MVTAGGNGGGDDETCESEENKRGCQNVLKIKENQKMLPRGADDKKGKGATWMTGTVIRTLR